MAIEKIHVSAWPGDEAWMPSILAVAGLLLASWIVAFFGAVAAMAVYLGPVYLFFEVFGVASDRTQMSIWRWSYYTDTLGLVYGYPMIVLTILCMFPALWGFAVTRPFDQAVKNKEGGLLGKVFRGMVVDADADTVQPTDESRPTLIRALRAVRIGYLPIVYALSWTWGIWKFNRALAILATIAITIAAFVFEIWLLELVAMAFCFGLIVNGQVRYWAQWWSDHKAVAADSSASSQEPSDEFEEIHYRR